MKYIIANWKAHKNFEAAGQWLAVFSRHDLTKLKGKLQVIICPPFPFISLVKERLARYDFIKVGAQDVSFFAEGPRTGEVAAENLAGLVDYVIIGHSERRRYFAETTSVIFQKCGRAQKNRLEPIFCLRDVNDIIASKVRFVAYEPVAAVGTGDNEPLAKVLQLKKQLRLSRDAVFIYGGSVDEKNASDYLNSDAVDGLLVGGASLDADAFYAILAAAAALF